MVPILLALGLVQMSPVPHGLERFDRLADILDPIPSVVVLDCQVAAKALKDCKAVDDGEASTANDRDAVDEALRMASQIVVPDGVAGNAGPRSIRVRLNVTP